MTRPKVSMIISNFNGLQLNLIKDCIDSLLKPHYRNWELIVVDNASTDGSVEYLKRRLKKYKNCKVLENPINMYSQGLNLGAKKATGKYLAYFNNDVAITKTYLGNLIKEFEKDNKLAIAQGKLLNYKDHRKIDSAGETMDIFGNPITVGYSEPDKGQFDKSEDILSASGSACMIKKSIFQRIGGYDPTYGIGYEDMDLALRARRFGYKVKRFPKAVVYHKRAATDLADFIRVKVKWHFNKNRLITMIKNYPLSLIVKTLPVTILLYISIILYEGLIRRNWKMGWVRLTATLWVLYNLPAISVSRSKIFLNCTNQLTDYDLSLFSKRTLFSLYNDFIAKSQ